jgi:hypothetical protein
LNGHQQNETESWESALDPLVDSLALRISRAAVYAVAGLLLLYALGLETRVFVPAGIAIFLLAGPKRTMVIAEIVLGVLGVRLSAEARGSGDLASVRAIDKGPHLRLLQHPLAPKTPCGINAGLTMPG